MQSRLPVVAAGWAQEARPPRARPFSQRPSRPPSPKRRRPRPRQRLQGDPPKWPANATGFGSDLRPRHSICSGPRIPGDHRQILSIDLLQNSNVTWPPVEIAVCEDDVARTGRRRVSDRLDAFNPICDAALEVPQEHPAGERSDSRRPFRAEQFAPGVFEGRANCSSAPVQLPGAVELLPPASRNPAAARPNNDLPLVLQSRGFGLPEARQKHREGGAPESHCAFSLKCTQGEVRSFLHASPSARAAF